MLDRFNICGVLGGKVTFKVAKGPGCSCCTMALIIAKHDTEIPFKDLETEVKVNGDPLFGPTIAPPVPSTDLLPTIELICCCPLLKSHKTKTG
jgi:hypothetical protein